VRGRFEYRRRIPLDRPEAIIHADTFIEKGEPTAELKFILNNLAALYFNESRYAEAESFYRRALSIYEKAFGPDHHNVSNILCNLSLLYAHE